MIPKFSIRQMLLAMVAFGVVASCIAGASRGSIAAFGLIVAIIGTILPLLVYAAVHWGAFGLAKLVQQYSNRRKRHTAKPVGSLPTETPNTGNLDG